MKVRMSLPHEYLHAKCSKCTWPTFYVYFWYTLEAPGIKKYSELYKSCVSCTTMEETTVPDIEYLE